MPLPERLRKRVEPLERGEHRSLRSAVLEVIRRELLTGDLPPGEPISIRDLCLRFGGGQSAVREALCQLVSDGMVIAEDQRGFRASPLSARDLADVTRSRVEIEAIALRDAIANGDTEWEARVVSEFHRLSRLPKVEAGDARFISPLYKEQHRRFHSELVSASTSDWMTRFYATLFDHSERYRELVVAAYAAAPPTRDVLAEHRELMAAVLDRDSDRAVNLATAHIEATAASLLRLNSLH
jgi:DNA-binding GntR family transcriptional regulator